MKNAKYLAVMLSLVMAAAALGGCSGSTESGATDTTAAETTADSGTAEDAGAEDSETVYGEVTAVGEDTITIAVGTLNDRSSAGGGAPEDMGEAGSGEATDESGETAEGAAEPETAAEASDAGEMSILDLTGDEQVITVTENTTYTRTSMGGGNRGGMGDGAGGAGRQRPDGESGEVTELPEGESGEAMEQPDGEGGEVPAMPDGENVEAMELPEGESGEAPGMLEGESGGAPEMPEGESGEAMEMPGGGSGEAMEQPDGENGGMGGDASETISLSDISEGDVISVTFDSDGNAAAITVYSMSMGGGMGDGGSAMGGGSGQSGQPDSYTAVTEYTSDETVEGETFTSEGTDENAIHVLDSASVVFRGIAITRTSSDSTGGDDSSFYGVGASLLVTDGTAYVVDSTVNSDASGGAGIFAYGEGVVYVADTTIVTKQDTSGGIHVAGGGTLYAWDLDVETSGESAAAIRSDRGSGTMVVNGGTYTSNGTGSPAVYSTADITVNGATLTANGSEAVCIEGLNTLRLFDCDLTGNMADDSQNDCTWNVILYQSMSGDSEEGNSTFEMVGGSLTAKNGGMFCTTNTESTFILSGVDIVGAADSEFFLRCTGNANQRGWGSTGSNGADCLFTAVDQVMEGDIIWDSISELDFYMTEGSTLTGAVLDDESCAGNGGDGTCSLYIAEGCTWTVTGDSTLTSLYSAGAIVDADGNTVTIQGSDGTVYVEGTGSCTVTVDSYEETVDLSGASTVDSWSDYEVEKPSELA